jgi:hypothetical protein
MTKDYGRPANAEENRALVKRRLEELAESDALRETLTVEWRTQPRHLEIIQVPIGNLYYNPATHRVRAQRSHDASRDALLEADPWSAGSQAYLESLLKAMPANPSQVDPEFVELRDSLKECSLMATPAVRH